MGSEDLSAIGLIEETLRFEYCSGAVTKLEGCHTTGWRQLPDAVCAQAVGGKVRMEFDGGRKHELGYGQAFVIPAGIRHCITKTTAADSWSRWAHFRATVLHSVDALSLLDIPPAFDASVGEKLGDACAQLADCSVAGAPLPLAAIAMRKSLGMQLLSIIAGASSIREGASQFLDGSRRLAPVFRTLRDNPERAYALDELAGMVHLSPSRFHALFRKTLGVPPAKYVQRLRMDRARTLLLTTDLTASEIAERSGYGDPFHFSRIFKKTCGLSPQHYRQQVRAGF